MKKLILALLLIGVLYPQVSSQGSSDNIANTLVRRDASGDFDAGNIKGTTLESNSGTTINEFSIDGTLAGNSDDAIPTEKAVKAYADVIAAAETDDQKIDVFSISGNNVQLSLESDGEATKTVDISTTTAVTDNTTHRGSDGTDHTFIDQDLRTSFSPVWAGLSLTGNFDMDAGFDDVQLIFTIVGDADSDAGNDVSETFSLTLLPNADPLSAYWGFTSTQSLGYRFDKAIGIGITPIAGVRLLLPQESDAATPTLAFGTGVDGIHSNAPGSLSFVIAGTQEFNLLNNTFRGISGSAGALLNENSTATNPSLVPNIVDVDTGIGSAAADQVSLIAGAKEGTRISEGSGYVSSISGHNVVEVIIGASTTAAAATLTKVGENFNITCSVGDAVLIYAGATTADYGTYIITEVTSATVLTVDRNFTGSNADVNFHVLADGVIIENATDVTNHKARLRVPENAYIGGDLAVGGTVDGIDIGVDVPLNTSKVTMAYPSAGIALSTGSAWSASITNNSANWNTAYTDRLKWDGGATDLVAATGRTSLGGTTIGQSIFIKTNPGAITFGRANADNSFDWLSATNFRTAIGVDVAGTDNSTDVTLNANATAAGLSLTTQEINYRAATNAQTGYATAAQITAQEANTSLLNVTPGTATASKALVVDTNKDIDLGTGDILATDGTFAGDLAVSGTTSFPSGYTRHIDLQIGAATLGPNAPTATTIGTFRGLGFDADNEEAFVNYEIPSDWDGASDMIFELHWYSTSGDIIANGETVKWDITYRSIAAGEAVDNGTAVSVTATFTGGASETDKEHYETSLTIDYDNANQPLAVGDDLGIQFDRDVTGDSYTGAGIVYRIDLTYTSNALPEN